MTLTATVQKGKRTTGASIMIALANTIRKAFTREKRPSIYHNDKEIQLDRARQDLNRLWTCGF